MKTHFKKILVPTILCFSILSNNAYALDQYGQDVTYKADYKKHGCSELAWSQMVASYNSKVNTVNAQSAKLNEGIMNAIVDPNKLDLGQCMGDISSVYNQVVKNAEKINDQLENIKSGSFKQLAGAFLSKMKDQLMKRACTMASNQINRGLNKLGVNEYLSEFNNMSQNPFGYALNKTGADAQINNSLNQALNNEWGNIVRQDVGTAYRNAQQEVQRQNAAQARQQANAIQNIGK
jgi:hypothetical protein